MVEDATGRIERLARRVRRRHGAEAAAWFRIYHDGAAEGALAPRADGALVGAALSALALQRRPRAAAPAIRLFNPDAKADGWTSRHSVLQIVEDDMPFVIDSVAAEINRQNLAIHRTAHRVVHVRRGRAGRFLSLADGAEPRRGAGAELAMDFEITELRAPAALDRLRGGLAAVLRDVRRAVGDWQEMRAALARQIALLDEAPPPAPEAEIAEARTFLRWLDAGNYTFIGYREYAFARRRGRTVVSRAPGSDLGVLRDPAQSVLAGWADGAVVPEEAAAYVLAPRPVVVSKANGRARVHRAVHPDAVMVKVFDDRGAVAGLRVFVGLFTSAVYHQRAADIPMLSRRIDAVLDRAGFRPGGHDAMSLLNVLDSLPRDDLFQQTEDETFETAMGVLGLRGRQRLALFVRRDPFRRFVSCLIFLPRERYDTALRERIQAILEDGFGGAAAVFYVQLSEAPEARLQFIVRLDPDRRAAADPVEIERRLAEAARDWRADLAQALAAAHGEARGLEVWRRYARAFPAGYRERTPPEAALDDVAALDEARDSGAPGARLYRAEGRGEARAGFKIYRPGQPLVLSDVLPTLENMGVRVIEEIPHRVVPDGAGDAVWVQDFGIEARDGRAIDVPGRRGDFEELFAGVRRGEVEDDGFNALVLAAGLDGRRISILRACCKYLLQAATPFSQTYMEATLAANPQAAAAIVALFEATFDPRAPSRREARVRALLRGFEAGLDRVESLDQTRILRRFRDVVRATLRTNYFQAGADGRPKPWLSFKIDSPAVGDLPAPAPEVEIFVCSPRLEAVHLRGGKVARGGIRWSDRREDFRTEILGLMKAQMAKNGVIVPVGAKGGFVVKRPPPGDDRRALHDEAVACYETMISAMLDLTDDMGPGGVVHPEAVVRRDGPDPYLVVAADKGTATFSDVANSVARSYGFWLDDAFASGGSVGYDHKKMGITARGAWESVKRHFRELGIDVQTRDFTCVGIGDMSGDVFGNGMLASRRIRLVGAFNHAHVFVDPDPDAARSWAERRRLFRKPRSSWADYDPALISEGGGVFDRRAKSIPVTPQMRDALGLPAGGALSPNGLVRAMLKAPVDLLWFGGIGTFVKARGEAASDAADPVNDAVRADAEDLRCRVVGEGANLGVTQRGRVAYDLAGGRINADFIDNSGGVSTSDHEVNIKILLGEAMAAGRLSRAERDALLAAMTEEVAGSVLMDNYRQSMAITHAEAAGAAMVAGAARFMRRLERAGLLDRALESLPDDETLARRRAAGRGLARPEIAVLLAYAKTTLHDELLASDVPDDPFLAEDIGLYFPSPLRSRFADLIPRHPLRREISATYVTNSLVNRVGPVFLDEIVDKTGAAAPEAVKAYLIARQVFGLRGYWAGIEALDNRIDARVQTALNLEIQRLIAHVTAWMLRNGPRPLDVARETARYAAGVAELAGTLEALVPAALRARLKADAARRAAQGVPRRLARRTARLAALFPACGIVRIAAELGSTVAEAARVHFALGDRLGLDWLREAADALPVETDWQARAAAALAEDLHAHQSGIAARVVESAPAGARGEAAVDAWWTASGGRAERARAVVDEMRAAAAADLAMLTVASGEIRALLGRQGGEPLAVGRVAQDEAELPLDAAVADPPASGEEPARRRRQVRRPP